MKKALTALSVIAALSSVISACVGVFYTNGGAMRIVENIYGQQITLYGDGIYANNSLLKVGATKGTDIVMLVFLLFKRKPPLVWKRRFLCVLLRQREDSSLNTFVSVLFSMAKHVRKSKRGDMNEFITGRGMMDAIVVCTFCCINCCGCFFAELADSVIICNWGAFPVFYFDQNIL
jgi:hypothetical protein